MSVERAYRLWRLAGLQVPRKRPRRRIAAARPRPAATTGANQLWRYDFVFDWCANGQKLKCLTVTDAWTREGLAIEVDGRVRSSRVIEVLSRLASGMVAPMVLDGPINRAAFTACVEQSLVPQLEPGALVVLDNLSSHRGGAVRRLIRAAGAELLFLPSHSPDCRPIENAFAKRTAHPRRAAERTRDGLWRAIALISNLYSPVERARCFAAAGYDATRPETALAGGRPARPAASFSSACHRRHQPRASPMGDREGVTRQGGGRWAS